MPTLQRDEIDAVLRSHINPAIDWIRYINSFAPDPTLSYPNLYQKTFNAACAIADKTGISSPEDLRFSLHDVIVPVFLSAVSKIRELDDAGKDYRGVLDESYRGAVIEVEKVLRSWG